MMKKYLFTLASVVILVSSSKAQDDNFDKKFRFGIRATPQPSWIKSNNKNSVGNGAVFGFGFGLITEFKLSKIVHFSTGIGGDFEGGRISFRADDKFTVNAVVNNEGEYVEAKDNMLWSEYAFKDGYTQYQLKERHLKTTFITIPLLLKMMTQEYSGLKYFAQFGGELGIRAGVKATDSYVVGYRTNINGPTVATNEVSGDDLKLQNVNVSKDGSLLPFRFGMNLGAGTEYRIAGTTSLLFSVNYFQSFTNLMRKDSKILVKGSETKVDESTGKVDFTPLNQGYFMRAVRINIGLLF
jgi:hypothetical protein